jgi:hypothetical protein
MPNSDCSVFDASSGEGERGGVHRRNGCQWMACDKRKNGGHVIESVDGRLDMLPAFAGNNLWKGPFRHVQKNRKRCHNFQVNHTHAPHNNVKMQPNGENPVYPRFFTINGEGWAQLDLLWIGCPRCRWTFKHHVEDHSLTLLMLAKHQHYCRLGTK